MSCSGVEQVIRPTGLLDPEIDVRPVEGQIDDLIGEINKEIAKKNTSSGNYSDEADGRGFDGLYGRSWVFV